MRQRIASRHGALAAGIVLAPTPQHPSGSGRFKSAPADLGLWNVFANPDVPRRRRPSTRL